MRRPSRDPPSMYSSRIWSSPPRSNMPWHRTMAGWSAARRIAISRAIWRRTASSWFP
uniref:MKK4-putative MAPKK n=1 Tax=Arundo donax TaxID=35708 RepID=A0A0A9GDN6_ARUDO